MLCRSGETESRGPNSCLLGFRVCRVGLQSSSLEAQRILEPVVRRVAFSSKDVYVPQCQNLCLLYVTWQRGIWVADGIKDARHLTLRWGSYPG